MSEEANDLDQKLEAELASEIASPRTTRSREASAGLPPWLKVGLVLGLLAGVVVFTLLGTDAGDAFVYSKPVAEVMADPAAFAGRDLRVEGDLQQGSVRFREDPCEWRFTIARDGVEMPVSFPQCIVPDTFRDDYGIIVTVQGRLEDGVFVASELVPRCPSKYEERLEAGESMPDHMPPVVGG